ncbi:anthranilate synthase component I family protein [Nocardioides sp. BP30]|uniref:anthranilate synthase component I family protein n=1 Tax=Nocardioides sp. BP30 TaxID=3036374 RepID=UPI0024686FFB|nr:anthranilate synthase component I family protein [Nocardioides sp. BP30]WGL52731.1 anthranilate synthase component I family protein [Nocardioides sp. BP30]
MSAVDRWVEVAGRRFEADLSLTYSAATAEVRLHRTADAGGGVVTEVVGDDVWVVLRGLLDQGLTAAGYLGYACRRDLPARPSTGVPDAVLVLCERSAVLTPRGQNRTLSGKASPPSLRFGPPGVTAADRAPAPYRAAFAEVQQALHAGDTYETNLTYRITGTTSRTPEQIRAALEPTPYAGMLVHDLPDVDAASAWLISASPECYARIADGVVETRPIKGTTARGATASEDAANAERLRTDRRFRAENLMITDLLRNDLAQVCVPGTVEVPELMAVESYASVHQLVTTVRGRLRTGLDALDAVHALFPAGSMTGAPKLRTMELIDRLEDTPRGAYAGAFGWLTRDAADLGVVIRSLSSPDGRTWTLGTGGGVTVHSDVEEEYAETGWKAARLLNALGL